MTAHDPNYCRQNFRPGLVLLWILILILLGLVAESATAARLHKEAWYQAKWCTNGEIEHILPDRTRVDCLTATHAIEVDFANKWYEGYAQGLWYACNTGRKAGLLLIVENPDKDMQYFHRANRMRDHYGDPLDIWVITPAQAEQLP